MHCHDARRGMVGRVAGAEVGAPELDVARPPAGLRPLVSPRTIGQFMDRFKGLLDRSLRVERVPRSRRSVETPDCSDELITPCNRRVPSALLPCDLLGDGDLVCC